MFTASVGLWTFIDQATNLRNPSANITTLNTPFVPAVPGGSAIVISFFGNKDSYILLENTGDLAVSSFTWLAMIFPEGTANGLTVQLIFATTMKCLSGYMVNVFSSVPVMVNST